MIPVLFFLFGAISAAKSGADYVGAWIYQDRGSTLLRIDIKPEGDGLSVIVTHPKNLQIGPDGTVTAADSTEVVSEPASRATFSGGVLQFADGPTLTLSDPDHANLQMIPQFKAVVLARGGPEARVNTRPNWPPEIVELRSRLADLVAEDQAARLSFDKPRMIKADQKSRDAVIGIMDRYGWVTFSLAGSDAAHNFWLLVQHQDLRVQQRGLEAMKDALSKGGVSKTDYAYLSDRVSVREGKPQHWGTQTHCDNGSPVLDPVDDPAGLDARRADLGLAPEAEYLKDGYLLKSCQTMGAGH